MFPSSCDQAVMSCTVCVIRREYCLSLLCPSGRILDVCPQECKDGNSWPLFSTRRVLGTSGIIAHLAHPDASVGLIYVTQLLAFACAVFFAWNAYSFPLVSSKLTRSHPPINALLQGRLPRSFSLGQNPRYVRSSRSIFHLSTITHVQFLYSFIKKNNQVLTMCLSLF